MAQTTYVKDPPIGITGQISSAVDNTIVHRAAEGALVFGRVCSRGTDQTHQAIPAAVAADITDEAIGIVIQDPAKTTGATGQYDDEENANILRRGRIFVLCVDASVVGDPVRAQDAGGAIIATAGAGVSDVAGAVFLRSAGAGAITEIEIDFTGQ